MKRRILPALLALVMVLSLLPVAALAADAAVDYKNAIPAPLEDHPESGEKIAKVDDSIRFNCNDRPAVAGSEVKEYDVKLSISNLKLHQNADHARDYWAGIAVPAAEGAQYAWGWHYYDAAATELTYHDKGDDSFTNASNMTYESFYFPLEANSNTDDHAYLVVDTDEDEEPDVVYYIDFTGTTLAVPFAAGWELGAETDEKTGAVIAANGENWKAVLGDHRTTTVEDLGIGVPSGELNTDGYVVCAEAGANGREYNVKVLHDGLRIHANANGKLGWWVGVTFPAMLQAENAPATGEMGAMYKVVSFKSDKKDYSEEDGWTFEADPTLYFDVSEGTSRTVTIGYELNKDTNYYASKDYAGKTIEVTYKIDLSGVKMLDGKLVDGADVKTFAEKATMIDIGTVLRKTLAKKNASDVVTVTNKIDAYPDRRTEAEFAKMGVAALTSGTANTLDPDTDDVMAALVGSNYELEVNGVGKVYLDKDAVADLQAAAGTDCARIAVCEQGEDEAVNDLNNSKIKGIVYAVAITGASEDGQPVGWNIPLKDDATAVSTYTVNVSGDFGTAPFDPEITMYKDLPKPIGDTTVTESEVNAVPAAQVDLSFYAGRSLRQNDLVVVGIEPYQIVVTNTNPAVAADAEGKTITIYKDDEGGPLECFAIYEGNKDLSYDPGTGYATVHNATTLGQFVVLVSQSTGGGGSGSSAGGTGSSSGNTNPGGTTPPAQTVVKETVASTTTGTTASATVTSTTMDRVVNSAISQAKKAGNTPVVEISIPVAAEAENLEVSLPTASLGKLAEAAGSELVISSTIATVELDHTALAALVAGAGDSATVNLEFTLVDPDDLTGAQAEAMQTINGMLSETEIDAEIVDISLMADGNAVHEYNNGSISVTVPFTLPTGATASNVRVYYLDDEGALTRCTASYADGKVTFVTNHLSKYIISAKALLPEANFSDVAAGEYYYDAVAWAVANNVTTGTTETTFSPNEGCTRAQIVTFLWRAYGQPEAAADVNFTDIDANEYYYNAVKWAVEKGITTGTGDGTTFSPNQVCTRAEAVTFQKRAAGMNTIQGTASDTFTDVEAGAFYDSAVVWAVANGITTGTSTTTFSPYDYCTRAQIVTFLYRQLG